MKVFLVLAFVVAATAAPEAPLGGRGYDRQRSNGGYDAATDSQSQSGGYESALSSLGNIDIASLLAQVTRSQQQSRSSGYSAPQAPARSNNGGYSAPGRSNNGGYSAPSRSNNAARSNGGYSAPARSAAPASAARSSYSAPARSSSAGYSAPARSAASQYSAPALPARSASSQYGAPGSADLVGGGCGGGDGGFGGCDSGANGDNGSNGGNGADGGNGGDNGVYEQQVHKHVYIHVAPSEAPEPKPVKPSSAPLVPEKHYKILFIRAPEPAPYEQPDISDLPPPPEQKTLVYVLLKKPDATPPIQLTTPAPTKPSKPEVYFIRYKSPEGNNPGRDGSSDGAYGAPSAPVVDSDAGSGATAPGSEYGLPSRQNGY